MKRLFSILTLLVAYWMPLTAEAAPIKVEQARTKAVEFFTASMPTRAVPSFELVWDGESQATRSSEEPALYVFNRTDADGFVIMAGDDAMAPVLGYSFTHPAGDPNRMPENVRYWLDGLRQMVREARDRGDATHTLWMNEMKAGTPVRELPTALWDQGDPWNKECPVLPNGRRAVTGCVQTAAGILMKYHRWPDVPEGTVPGYTTYPHNISMPERTLKPYNYDLILDKYESGNYTDEQANEVARMMVDLGTANKATYDSETGAFTAQLVVTMGKYMRYNKQARNVYRSGYTDEKWIALIKSELDANRPLIYSGAGSQGGHCFILDGYDSENYLRFNWGWGGHLNGYFLVTSLTPQGSSFTDEQEFIVNLTPDKNGTTDYSDNLMIGSNYQSKGLTLSTTEITKGTTFTASATFYNVTIRNYSGKVAAAVVSQTGVVESILSNEISTEITAAKRSGGSLSIYGSTVQNLNCTMTQDASPGDRIRLVFWDNGGQNWVPMGAYNDGTVYEYILVPEAPDAASIAESAKLSYNRTSKELTVTVFADVKVTLKNASGSTVYQGTSDGTSVIINVGNATGKHTLTLQYKEGDTFSMSVVL